LQDKEKGKKKNRIMLSNEDGAAMVSRGLNCLIENAKNDANCKRNPPHISHYRELPDNVKAAYAALSQGASLVRASATKYSLMGTINKDEQTVVGNDLLHGCELIGAGVHVTLQDSSGCSRAVRQYNQKAALNVYLATLRLVEVFNPEIRNQSSSTPVTITVVAAAAENNIGAQKTGVVWESCDHILNKMLPQGNRNAIRRELFTWTRECNATMEEFQKMIDLGPRETDDDEVEDKDVDEFDEDQYSECDFPIAVACLALIKNSRGNMKIALETLEAVASETQDDDDYLTSIKTIHCYARRVGMGVTDLGSMIYPPLFPQQSSDLQAEVLRQVAAIVEFQDYILGLKKMSSKITELALTLKNAAENKRNDLTKALERCESIVEQ